MRQYEHLGNACSRTSIAIPRAYLQLVAPQFRGHGPGLLRVVDDAINDVIDYAIDDAINDAIDDVIDDAIDYAINDAIDDRNR